MNNQKKETKGDLERRMRNAIVFVPKDKETISVFFDDRGLRLTVTADYAIIETGAHRHVFSVLTTSGISRPYVYTKRLVEISLANDCTVKDSQDNITRSYTRLMSVLKEKDDKTEYNIAWYIDLWLFNIFAPLYSIDESDACAFMTYEIYLHNMARQSFLLEEHKEDVTNHQFFNEIIEREKSFFADTDEHVVLAAKTDEQRMQEELSAMSEIETEQQIGNDGNDGAEQQ